ncbi:RNA-binding protein [Leptolyngbya sp. FACHB-261]|uniref:RNA recognition motif domain-containing protein n=1 Tax=Leptolyngbya sp. FACHB-261 TaxID=2692806 RepID=UPI001682876A|nr:RNA-binding protein [Leptolyngbya sp. FACHB-261]MBD2101836.1 RNA-binding protein [Leptolyngbya sp. FACHB-261]
MSIYVGNLPSEITIFDLNKLFSEYGEVLLVQLPTERSTGRSCGFALVDMKVDTEAEAAIDALDGFKVVGRYLRVKKDHHQDFRGATGSFGGGDGNYFNHQLY